MHVEPGKTRGAQRRRRRSAARPTREEPGLHLSPFPRYDTLSPAVKRGLFQFFASGILALIALGVAVAVSAGNRLEVVLWQLAQLLIAIAGAALVWSKRAALGRLFQRPPRASDAPRAPQPAIAPTPHAPMAQRFWIEAAPGQQRLLDAAQMQGELQRLYPLLRAAQSDARQGEQLATAVTELFQRLYSGPAPAPPQSLSDVGREVVVLRATLARVQPELEQMEELKATLTDLDEALQQLTTERDETQQAAARGAEQLAALRQALGVAEGPLLPALRALQQRLATSEQAQQGLATACEAWQQRAEAAETAREEAQGATQQLAGELEALRAQPALTWRAALTLMTHARATSRPTVRATRDALRAAGIAIPNVEYADFSQVVKALASASVGSSASVSASAAAGGHAPLPPADVATDADALPERTLSTPAADAGQGRGSRLARRTAPYGRWRGRTDGRGRLRLERRSAETPALGSNGHDPTDAEAHL